MRFHVDKNKEARDISERLIVVGNGARNVVTRYYVTTRNVAVIVWDWITAFLFTKDGFGIQTKDGYIIKCKDQ